MKKLKKFQKFALTTKQASKVRGGGGLVCHYGNGFTTPAFEDSDAGNAAALRFCGRSDLTCHGCF